MIDMGITDYIKTRLLYENSCDSCGTFISTILFLRFIIIKYF